MREKHSTRGLMGVASLPMDPWPEKRLWTSIHSRGHWRVLTTERNFWCLFGSYFQQMNYNRHFSEKSKTLDNEQSIRWYQNGITCAVLCNNLCGWVKKGRIFRKAKCVGTERQCLVLLYNTSGERQIKSGLKKWQNLCDGRTENHTNYNSLIMFMSEIFQI